MEQGSGRELDTGEDPKDQEKYSGKLRGMYLGKPVQAPADGVIISLLVSIRSEAASLSVSLHAGPGL